MTCVFCGGHVASRKSAFVYDSDDAYFVVENVPAQVCTQCGERTYSPQVTDELIRLGKRRSQPMRLVEVPVFDYAVQV